MLNGLKEGGDLVAFLGSPPLDASSLMRLEKEGPRASTAEGTMSREDAGGGAPQGPFPGHVHCIMRRSSLLWMRWPLWNQLMVG